MVALKLVQQSNARLTSLPKGAVALFIGATSGIGQSALQNFAKHVPSPRIYTVARPQSAPSHEALLDDLRKSSPGGTYTLITADVSLISEVDRVVEEITRTETKLDFLVMSAGFMAFEGRVDTREGLDPSMTTRYYSRLRAVSRLLPLLNNPGAESPRVLSVLAGGKEASINEDDLDLRRPGNWAYWPASVQSATMGTLALEKLARENPRVSFVHWYPGPVSTRGLARSKRFGMAPPSEMSQEESGERALFLATSDRYVVEGGGSLAPLVEGLEIAKKSGGGVFLVDPLGDSSDNESILADFRSRGVDEKVWRHTLKIFDDCVVQV
ncbi:short-chain dehydrogenase reductase [Colletotrichum truncatum]|uniref:Short-chain dehydrogenase reductase n=1 Tax=Colletotrichum truncatum TaxID=5467 RepID=A0ACC3ZBN4_COLTU|nr:short-chain dehydrogenase reductase [Colletotrichum truncatum]KAF6787826.1 short-chain dehydrogenase reductase [Colletotrichum truncatum]